MPTIIWPQAYSYIFVKEDLTYFRDNHKNNEDCCNDEIHPTDPPEEDEVGRYDGPEVGFDVLDPALPRDKFCGQIFQEFPQQLKQNGMNLDRQDCPPQVTWLKNQKPFFIFW